MSSGNGQQFNARLGFSQNADESGQEEYVDEYEEEYVQLPDGSLVSASQSGRSQNFTFSANRFNQSSRNQPSGSGVFRADVTRNSTSTPLSVFKYVKNESLPMDERKSSVPLLSSSQPASAQPIYHVAQQGPSAPFPYQQGSSSSFANPYPSMPRHDSNKPAGKSKRKHVAGQRKPCNCTKSMCLKLYCDCFANGEFCRDCNCKDCHNNMEYEGDRTRAIKASLERNPNAFKPKIGVTKAGQTDIERLHQKGCHCKKSGCLKNYCECYEAKVPCTDRCKCKGCMNTEADRNARFKDKLSSTALMNLANTSASTPTLGSSMAQGNSLSDDDSDTEAMESDPRSYPWFYMTDEVVEAATLCMVAQAEESLVRENETLQDSGDLEEMERLVLREFGRCLEQIISSASSAV